MTRTRLHLGIVLAVLGVLGAFWAVNAQDLFLPPPVLQPDAPPGALPEKKKAPAKYPFRTQPLEKPKADPTFIIPPEVFDVPRVLRPDSPLDGTPGLLLTDGGVVPPPVLPPALQPKESPAIPLPSLPVVEPKPIALPLIPTPPPDPTRVLIEPLTKQPPDIVKPGLVEKPMVLVPAAGGFVQGPPSDKPKAFVRLRSAANDVSPPPIDIIPPPSFAPPTAQFVPNPNALLNLHSPAVSVEKRGQATMRAGETQSYQIIVRNLGSVPAQQIRIEEEIPHGAKLIATDPPAQQQGTRAVWTLSALAPGSEQVVRLTLQADVALQLGNTMTAHVSATQPVSATVLRPQNLQNPASPLAVSLSGPERALVGKPVAFDIQVANQSGLPLTGVVLFGYLPEGLSTPEGRDIEGAVEGAIAPGGSKILKLPANAVKPGRYTVRVKVVTSSGEASATAAIDIAGETLMLQQAAMTRLMLGRDGELRFEVANGTGKPLRNVAIATQLPEGLDFVAASDRGMFQANHRTVYWLIDNMPAGQTQTLGVRVNGSKAGQYQSVVFARADGITEVRSSGTIALDGIASLKMRVVERDNPLELGKETVYEIQLSNTGGAPARGVQLQVQFPPGLIPRSAQGNTRHTLDRQSVVFDAVPSLAPDGQVVYRVSAYAQAPGDQRVRFSVVSDEVQTPLVREVSTKVY